MERKYKKLGIIVSFLFAAIMIITIIANSIIERRIVKIFDKLPESIKFEYSEIDANIWSGKLKLISANIEILGETTDKTILEAKLKSLHIDDLGYWDFLFNNKISVGTIAVNDLIAKYRYNPMVKKHDYKSGTLDRIKQIINVEKLSVNNADILITNHESDSTLLSVPKLNFELKNFIFDPKKKVKSIAYDDFKLNTKNFMLAINPYENVFVDDIHITDTKAIIKNLKLKTKYSRPELSTIVQFERDHYNMTIKEVILADMNFGNNEFDKFYFNSNKVTFKTPIAEIYRDKLLVDDLTYKPLYGKMLRDLDFILGFKSVEIIDGKISYLEKVKATEKAGQLDFSTMNVTMSNLGNAYGNEKTSIKLNSIFMENSPLKIDWNFKVADTTDQFMLKADLGFLNAKQMGQFMKPNLNIELTGDLKQTYFTISGDPRVSRIDLKVKYDDFKILILKSNGKEKNKLLSGLVNLFVSKDSEDEKQNYRYGQSDNVERNTNKSVFNFVWKNMQSGLLSAMAGDGEKDD